MSTHSPSSQTTPPPKKPSTQTTPIENPSAQTTPPQKPSTQTTAKQSHSMQNPLVPHTLTQKLTQTLLKVITPPLCQSIPSLTPDTIRRHFTLTDCDPQYGDLATTLPLKLAKLAKKSPIALGETIIQILNNPQYTPPLQNIGLKPTIRLAKPGFLNISLNHAYKNTQLIQLLTTTLYSPSPLSSPLTPTPQNSHILPSDTTATASKPPSPDIAPANTNASSSEIVSAKAISSKIASAKVVSSKIASAKAISSEIASSEAGSAKVPQPPSKILLEYISANPTGPLHIGHGRWAAYGSTLAQILRFTGHSVHEEFYVNDVGNQIENLNQSVTAIRDNQPIPETGYHGDYLNIFKQKAYQKTNPVETLLSEQQQTLLNMRVTFKPNPPITPKPSSPPKLPAETPTATPNPTENPTPTTTPTETPVANHTVAENPTLEPPAITPAFKTHFFRESSLRQDDKISEMLDFLEKTQLSYRQDGAIWFASQKKGDDDKDRVIVKSDGTHTYFFMDILYHFSKMQRGYFHLIDVLGADHHGYTQRIKAACTLMYTHLIAQQPLSPHHHHSPTPEESPPQPEFAPPITESATPPSPFKIDVIIGQLVNLYRNGQPIRMSKRTGEFIALSTVIEEIGVDALRYFLVQQDIATTLEFDLEKAKTHNMDNPIFYIQYAHARICSIFSKALDLNLLPKALMPLSPLHLSSHRELVEQTPQTLLKALSDTSEALSEYFDFALIESPPVKRIFYKLMTFHDELLLISKSYQIHHLPRFLYTLATTFHKLYNETPFLSHKNTSETESPKESESPPQKRSHTYLIFLSAIAQTLQTGLSLMHISCPQKM